MALLGNVFSFSLLVIWASYLPGDQSSRLELLVVMDLLAGVHIQRYVLLMIHCEDSTPYHEPGPLALQRRARRQKLALVMSFLTCATCAAASVVTAYNIKSPYSHYSDAAEYWFIVLALPALHAAMRTIVLDTQGCKRHIARLELTDDSATNSFTITDDDVEDGEESQDDAIL